MCACVHVCVHVCVCMCVCACVCACACVYVFYQCVMLAYDHLWLHTGTISTNTFDTPAEQNGRARCLKRVPVLGHESKSAGVQGSPHPFSD